MRIFGGVATGGVVNRRSCDSEALGLRPATCPFAAPEAEADYPITAHAAAWQTLAAVAERAIDAGVASGAGGGRGLAV